MKPSKDSRNRHERHHRWSCCYQKDTRPQECFKIGPLWGSLATRTPAGGDRRPFFLGDSRPREMSKEGGPVASAGPLATVGSKVTRERYCPASMFVSWAV